VSGEKVRPLSDNRPGKPFSLNGKLNDKDNVQRVPPPPQTVFLPHPALAPPGMGGTRLARQAERWMAEKKIADPDKGEKRTFKPFARSPDKDWTPHR
jgi:hypothetical protein